ncbi:MAG TPA: pyridoxal phosphate-dependent aminotransferase [Actinomycetota bacterium]|nr:pyridoxal phosphate-dependent aminotransferase [Actinomycetota bacterium]
MSARIGAIEESATLALEAKAKALRAAGEDVVGFGAGEPDFPTPAHIVAAAQAACANPRFHKYTPASGLPELREAIAVKTGRDSGVEVKPAQTLVTNGGKQAIYNAFQALLDPGDEVICPAPWWVTYPEAVRVAGGVFVEVPTTAETGYLASVEALEAARTPRTKVLLFVSPSNPTGAVYPRDQVEAIGTWAAGNGLWVLTDEIYEHLVYDGAVAASMPGVVPEIRDRCVIVNGVAKTFAMTGWRVGWMVGPADIVKGAINLQSHSTSNVNNVAQAAALAALTGDMECVEEMRQAFDRRRRTALKLLGDMDGVVCPEPKGAFYVYPSFERVLGHRVGGVTVNSTAQLCGVLLEKYKVAMVPGEAFGTPGYARVSYALGDDALVKGLTRIGDALAG